VTHGQRDDRPTVTFPASGHHRPLTGTKLYCLVNKGTCVWTTCPLLLPGSAPARIWTSNLMVTMSTPTEHTHTHYTRIHLCSAKASSTLHVFQSKPATPVKPCRDTDTTIYIHIQSGLKTAKMVDLQLKDHELHWQSGHYQGTTCSFPAQSSKLE